MSADAGALRAAGEAADREESQAPVGEVKQPCSTLWVEVRVVNDRGVPLKNERVWLLVSLVQSAALEKRTNDDGVARWGEGEVPQAGMYHVQLVDVLESWLPDQNGMPAEKPWAPKPGDYQKGDGFVHEVKPCVLAQSQEIRVARLTEREKIAHIIYAYVHNGATYGGSNPHTFLKDKPRYNWGLGEMCNGHVNFYLGYWFNYAEKITPQAIATGMIALPTSTSKNQPLWLDSEQGSTYRATHRGYKEFLEPITGGEKTFEHGRLKSVDPQTVAQMQEANRGKKNPPRIPGVKTQYFRFAKYVDRTTKKPKGGPFDRLGDYNVYSISDLSSRELKTTWRKAALGWFAQNPAHAPKRALNEQELYDYVWDMDDADPDVFTFLNYTLFGITNTDHHCGILFKRDGDLLTFPADGGGTKKRGPAIEVKSFADAFMHRKMLFLAFWKVKPLRLGGYAPAEAEALQKEISVDNVSRMIEWGKVQGGAAASSKQKVPVKNVTKRSTTKKR